MTLAVEEIDEFFEIMYDTRLGFMPRGDGALEIFQCSAKCEATILTVFAAEGNNFMQPNDAPFLGYCGKISDNPLLAAVGVHWSAWELIPKLVQACLDAKLVVRMSVKTTAVFEPGERFTFEALAFKTVIGRMLLNKTPKEIAELFKSSNMFTDVYSLVIDVPLAQWTWRRLQYIDINRAMKRQSDKLRIAVILRLVEMHNSMNEATLRDGTQIHAVCDYLRVYTYGKWSALSAYQQESSLRMAVINIAPARRQRPELSHDDPAHWMNEID